MNNKITKESILDIAQTIAHSEGWQALTMRNLADKASVSLPVLYRLFEDKDDLLLELVKISYAELIDKVDFLKNNSTNILNNSVNEIKEYFFNKPHIFDFLYRKNTFSTLVYRRNIQSLISSIIDDHGHLDADGKAELVMTIIVGEMVLGKDPESKVGLYLDHILQNKELVK